MQVDLFKCATVENTELSSYRVQKPSFQYEFMPFFQDANAFRNFGLKFVTTEIIHTSSTTRQYIKDNLPGTFNRGNSTSTCTCDQFTIFQQRGLAS